MYKRAKFRVYKRVPAPTLQVASGQSDADAYAKILVE